MSGLRCIVALTVVALAADLAAQGVADATSNAFSLPLPFLTAKERRAFAVGNSFFKQNWVTAPASTAGRDGLGPLFNARSCSSCHFRDGRSQPPVDDDRDRSGLLVRIGVRQPDGPDLPHPRYGGQIQDVAVQGIAPEASVRIGTAPRPGSYGDGEPFELLAPEYELRDLGYGELGEGTVLGARVAPQMVGLGLLEAIPVAALLAGEDPDDRDGDGISGRAHRLADGAIGRFGWKATQPTVEAQAAAAFVNDIGITSALEPDEALAPSQRQQLIFASGGAPEIEARTFERVVFYSRTLAVPDPRGVDDPEVRRGSALFGEFGCALCHVPEHTTGAVDWHADINELAIRPYTDLLLHDLGEGLADQKRDGDALPAEWRTPPLWGIGLVPVVNGHTRYLHDGRARDLAEAVLWHGGEAFASRERFRLAPRPDRAALLAFLSSL
ncbi:MAG: thiol oxidoreductase [Planctomycetes bacterium]|nr:thiol oxidoreductase [Planctomycetota bacterium]